MYPCEYFVPKFYAYNSCVCVCYGEDKTLSQHIVCKDTTIFLVKIIVFCLELKHFI